ncbi:retrovirus-related pol polyprotein from transposon TNT 1-94 [Tanacetum coccineum]
MVNNKPLIIHKWDINMCLDKTGPEKIPLWVKICNVHLEAWTVKGISALASRIRRQMIMDFVTAAMCEMGPDNIDVMYKNGVNEVVCRKNIKEEYDWMPPMCLECCMFGHTTQRCGKKCEEYKVKCSSNNDKSELRNETINNNLIADEGFIEVKNMRNGGFTKKVKRQIYKPNTQLPNGSLKGNTSEKEYTAKDNNCNNLIPSPKKAWSVHGEILSVMKSATHNVIMEAGGKDHAPMLVAGSNVIVLVVPLTDGNKGRPKETKLEAYSSVYENTKKRIDAEAKAVHIILTGIDNEIYSIVDACANAKEIWIATKCLMHDENINKFYRMMNELVRNKCEVSNHQSNVQFLLQLQPEWQRFVTIVKKGQKLREVSCHTLFDILKQHQNEVNELRAERLARNAIPLALVAAIQQQPSYYPQSQPSYNPSSSSTRSQAVIRNKGKEIARAPSPPAETGYERQTGQYENQRAVNVVKDRDTVQDSDEEPTDQELEAHYLYMAKIQEVIPTVKKGIGPVFDKEPLEQCDSNITSDSSDMSNNGREANQDEQKFQEHLTLKEHSTGCSYMPSDMNDFKNYSNHVKFEDISSSGLYFTWTKNLFKVKVGGDFIDKFAQAHVVFLPYLIFDHFPNMLVDPKAIQARRKAFLFANFIAEKEDFLPLGSEHWNDKYVKKLRDMLKNVQQIIDKDPIQKQLREEESLILKDYVDAMKDEDKILYQKVKIKWLSAGDRNNDFS